MVLLVKLCEPSACWELMNIGARNKGLGAGLIL